MAGIFDNPMTPPGLELRSAMALDEEEQKVIDPGKNEMKQKPGISQAASGDEEDPWAI